MAQHDYDLANGTGAAFRADANAALAAILTLNSGASEPSTRQAYMLWADTTAGQLKQRNAANTAWVVIGTLGSTNLGLVPASGGTQTNAVGSAAAPSYSFAGDTNTGFYQPGTDIVGVSINGGERWRWNASGYIKATGAGASLTTALTDANNEIASAAATTETLRITSGNASFANTSLYLVANRNTTNGTFKAIEYYNLGGANSRFAVLDSGLVVSIGSYNATTANAANLNIDAFGNIQRSTSSGTYKTNVQAVSSKAVDVVLQLNPIRYRSLAEGDNAQWSWYGFIAEEVAAIDPRLVHWGYREEDYETVITEQQRYNDETQEIETLEVAQRQLKSDAELHPEGVQYERVGVLTLAKVQQHETRIAELEARLAALES